jgi:hemoglobin
VEGSHRHLLVTAGGRAFMDDPQRSLDRFTVPAAEQAEVKALVESTRGGIVVG